MSSSQKLKDILGRGTNRYNKIRRDARLKCHKSNRLKKCERCGYDKHVEVCHIKAINTFELNALLSEVNHNDNLIILCPNCHWEFDNHNKKDRRICPMCQGFKNKSSVNCRKCTNAHCLHVRKVERPKKEQLEILVQELPLTHIGKKYGVSDNAIKKWCKSYGIILGNRMGYWAKKRCKQNNLVVRAEVESATSRL